MVARLRSWWQFIKTHRITIQFIAIFLAVAIAFIFASYRFGWSGTGFLNKTLWDWLQLLIIPLVLAIVALLFNRATTRTEQKIALDKQREDLLQTYLDCMSELLLEKGLATKPAEEARDARNLARVRTITILFQLDTRRIEYVFAFLREAGLMSIKPNSSIVSMREANLTKINLSRAIMFEANLSGAFLGKANLTFAGLIRADLSDTLLSEANLSGAMLSEANLSEADLSGAFLYGAKVTEEQLKKAKSLKGATMPDGSIHPSHFL
jgi:hypothetical protein